MGLVVVVGGVPTRFNGGEAGLFAAGLTGSESALGLGDGLLRVAGAGGVVTESAVASNSREGGGDSLENTEVGEVGIEVAVGGLDLAVELAAAAAASHWAR